MNKNKIVLVLLLVLMAAVLVLAGCSTTAATTPSPTITKPYASTPTTSPTPKTSDATPRITQTPPITSATPSPSPSPTPSPTLTTGSLDVFCGVLMGDIFVDGVRLASAQGMYGSNIKGLSPGNHSVKVSLSGWADWTKQVSIAAGKTTTLYAYPALGSNMGGPSRNEVITPDSAAAYGTLEMACGVLQGNIYVGGEPGGPPTGSTVRAIKGILPGTYTVKITLSGWADWSKQVTIATAQTTTLYAYPALGEDKGAPSRSEIITPDSAAAYGSLEVTSNLLLGNIYVGGEPAGPPTGSTVRVIKGLLPGNYAVKVINSGWKDWTGQAAISSGQKTTLTTKNVQ